MQVSNSILHTHESHQSAEKKRSMTIEHDFVNYRLIVTGNFVAH